MTANELTLFDLLDAPVDSILIENWHVLNWGNIWLFECLYNLETPKPFQLQFIDCRDVKLEVYEPIAEEGSIADMIGIFIGNSEHQEPAMITTDLFEITLSYDQLSIQKEW